MNPFELILFIAALVVIAGIAKSRRKRDASAHVPGDSEGLREEIRLLKERVVVLERIATDRAISLDTEIEKLRDR